MRQRCALARAFIVRPQVLLLDEPFGALDAMTRMTLQSVLKDLIEQERPTVLLVTHDVDEALYLADRVRKLVVPLLALTLASSAMAAEELRVGYGRAMDDAQVMLAQEAGLYEKYGLEAELLEFSSGTDLIKGIVGGQLDIGVLGFSNAFTWASRGADQKIVGGGPVAGRWPFGAAFLFEPYASIAKLQAPVEEIYEIGEVWPFPCMVVITSAETLENRRDVLWSAKNAQREAIDMLENDPALAATYITSYFVSGPVIETRDQGDSETVIEQAIRTNDFSAELTEADIDRMKELAVIMQEQGILQVEGEFDVNALLDLTWQEDREI